MRAFALLCTAALVGAGAYEFTIGVTITPPAANVRAMERRVLEVSDPDHVDYGKYMTQEEVVNAIGIHPQVTKMTTKWMADALAAVKAEDAKVKPMAHGDAVTATTENYFATYQLGLELERVTAPGAVPFQVPAPPQDMELFVTTNMPPDLCQTLTKDKKTCDDHAPCSWAGNHSHGACQGDFNGWICWANATHADGKQWHCFTPMTDGEVVDSRPKAKAQTQRRGPQRKGKLRTQDFFAEAAAKAAAGADLGFFVSHLSESFVLGYRDKNAHIGAMIGGHAVAHAEEEGKEKEEKKEDEEDEWTTVELTWQQEGAYKTITVAREDFGVNHRGAVNYLVGGVKNLRRIANISVCVNDKKANKESCTASPPDKGCMCDRKTGRDERLGRKCQRLGGSVPTGAPIDFIAPREAEGLQRLQKDLGIKEAGKGQSMYDGADGKVGLVVGEFIDQSFAQEDYNAISKAFGLRQPTKNITLYGPASRQEVSMMNSGEGSLDIQIAALLAPESNPGWWAVGPWYMEGFMLAYNLQVNDMEDPPLVHSISWGDNECVYPRIFVNRVDYETMKMGLRGITMVLATGDNGIRSSYSKCEFVADLIGTSPWVITVGATQSSLDSQPYCNMAETAVTAGECVEPGPIAAEIWQGSIITTSGFFSIYRKRPAFQEAAVQDWLRNAECKPCASGWKKWGPTELVTPCMHINESKWCDLPPFVQNNRVAPDLSVPGSSYPVIINGSWVLADGTSASAPAFAALLAKLNIEQQKRGQPPLGFVSPWIYKLQAAHPEAFIDVTQGFTATTVEEVCDWGWKAEVGWDAATGLGVPVYDVLWKHLPKAHRAPIDFAQETQNPSPVLMAVGLSLVVVSGSVGALAAAALLRSKDRQAREHRGSPLAQSLL